VDDAAILRAQKATSTDAARLEREARMAEVSEREKLEAALSEALANSGGALQINGQPWVVVPAEAQRAIVAAAHTHLAAMPKTKIVEVWRVEYAQETDGFSPVCQTFTNPNSARNEAERLRSSQYRRYACIHVTGPHQQEVPA
jgi:hypothetical protein